MVGTPSRPDWNSGTGQQVREFDDADEGGGSSGGRGWGIGGR